MTDHMPDAEREAMEWLERCSGHPCAATLKRMLANRFPARLHEEEAVAIAEGMRDAYGFAVSGQLVMAIWQRACQHLAKDAPRQVVLPERPTEEILGPMRHAWAEAGGNSWDIVRRIYDALYWHLSAPPKPPTPKTKTVFVVRASWSRPEARVKVIEWEGRGDAQMEASEQINAGAISVSITEEARP